LLEDVVTIKANGATTSEDVAICLNAHQSLLLLTWSMCVTKQMNNFQLIKTSCPMLNFHKVSRNSEAINSVI